MYFPLSFNMKKKSIKNIYDQIDVNFSTFKQFFAGQITALK